MAANSVTLPTGETLTPLRAYGTASEAPADGTVAPDAPAQQLAEDTAATAPVAKAPNTVTLKTGETLTRLGQSDGPLPMDFSGGGVSSARMEALAQKRAMEAAATRKRMRANIGKGTPEEQKIHSETYAAYVSDPQVRALLTLYDAENMMVNTSALRSTHPAATNKNSPIGWIMPDREPLIDYYTGNTNNASRATFALKDNPEDQERYLTKLVGPGLNQSRSKDATMAEREKYNWFYDIGGNLVLSGAAHSELTDMPNRGIPVAWDEHATSGEDFLDAVNDIPATLAAIVGTYLTGGLTGAGTVLGQGGRLSFKRFAEKSAATSTLATVGRLGVIGAAAAGAKGGQEIIEIALGSSSQSMGDVASDAAFEGALAVGGEWVSQMLMDVASFAARPEGGRMTAARVAGLNKAQEYGFAPRVEQITDGPWISRIARVNDMLFSTQTKHTQASREILDDWLNRFRRTFTAEIGVDDEFLANTMAASVQRQRRQLETELDGIMENLSRESTAEVRALQARISGGAVEVTDEDMQAIVTARMQFGTDFSERYGIIDARIAAELGSADAGIVDSRPLKLEAMDMARGLLRTEVEVDDAGMVIGGGQVVGTSEAFANMLAKINELPDLVSLRQMQDFRTTMREAATDGTLAPGAGRRRVKRLQKAADAALKGTVDNPPQVGDENLTSWVARTLRETDAAYREGIRVYDNTFLAAITRDPGRAGSIAPEEVVAAAMRSPAKARALRAALEQTDGGAARIQAVRAEMFDSLITEGQPYSDTASIEKFVGVFNTRAKRAAAATFFEPDELAEMSVLTRKIRAVNSAARFRLDDLRGDNIVEMLQQRLAAEKRLKAYNERNYVKNLSREGVVFENAVNFVFHPLTDQAAQGGALLTRQARESLGGFGSPAWEAVQERAMQKVLEPFMETVESAADPFNLRVYPQKMLESLNRFGRPQLNEMFGVEATEQLYGTVAAAKVAFRKPTNQAGMIAAANMALRPLAHLGAVAKFAVMGKVMNSKAGRWWLTHGFRLDPTQAGYVSLVTRAYAQIAGHIEDGEANPAYWLYHKSVTDRREDE